MLPQASTLAQDFDQLFSFIFWTSFVSFVGIVLATLIFILKYHRSKRDPFKTPFIHGHTVMETTVSVVLFIWVMVIFAWGWIDYKKILAVPSDALEINVIGKQWLWEFEYDNGRKTVNELVVPKGKPINLLMSSQDVIHSFFIPNFRLKNDVLPGRYTQLWFNATQLGEHQVMCAEFCGTAHSQMLAKVKVVEEKEYETWQQAWETQKPGVAKEGEKIATVSPVEKVKELFTSKGCVACHSVTGQKLIGPHLNGIFGQEVT